MTDQDENKDKKTKKNKSGTSTNQTLFVPGLPRVAYVDPQCLLPQCSVGYLHAEHLVDLHDILGQTAACSEETSSGLHAGQHRGTHIPESDKRPAQEAPHVKLRATRRLVLCSVESAGWNDFKIGRKHEMLQATTSVYCTCLCSLHAGNTDCLI